MPTARNTSAQTSLMSDGDVGITEEQGRLHVALIALIASAAAEATAFCCIPGFGKDKDGVVEAYVLSLHQRNTRSPLITDSNVLMETHVG